MAEKIDWRELAAAVGSITPNGERWRDEDGMASSERGGSDLAQRAIEGILGPSTIRDAVDFIIRDGGPGSELARSVLMLIASREAAEIAFEHYTSGDRQFARYAVSLIKDLKHPCAMDWVDVFLSNADPVIVAYGLSVFDLLVWSRRISPDDPRIESWLARGASHPDAGVREKAQSVQAMIEEIRGIA